MLTRLEERARVKCDQVRERPVMIHVLLLLSRVIKDNGAINRVISANKIFTA